MQKYLFYLLLALLFPCDTVACSCVPDPLQEALETGDAKSIKRATVQALKQADAVLFGRITALTEKYHVGISPQFGASGSEARFLVRHQWKGDLQEKVILRQGSDNCAARFSLGEQLLIFTGKNARGQYEVSICSVMLRGSEIRRSIVEALESSQKGKIFGPTGQSVASDLIIDATDGRFIAVEDLSAKP